jgi:hypothetical protein
MSFGSDLQGWQSHEALISIQDYEINLVEGLRKCIAHRAKCDRDYAIALSSVISGIAQRQAGDVNNGATPLGQVKNFCCTFCEETELRHLQARRLGVGLKWTVHSTFCPDHS